MKKFIKISKLRKSLPTFINLLQRYKCKFTSKQILWLANVDKSGPLTNLKGQVETTGVDKIKKVDFIKNIIKMKID